MCWELLLCDDMDTSEFIFLQKLVLIHLKDKLDSMNFHMEKNPLMCAFIFALVMRFWNISHRPSSSLCSQLTCTVITPNSKPSCQSAQF